mgnify:CR=1 FL=1
MNGIQDMGGMHCFGDVHPEADEQIRMLAPDVYVTGAESVDDYPTELTSAREVGGVLILSVT